MKHSRKIIYLASFLFSIPVAITTYINSSFLESYVSTNYIAIIYVIASLATIIGLLQMPKILTHLGNRKTSILFSVVTMFSLFLMAFGNNKFIVIFAFIVYFVSTNAILASLDVFMEDFSSDSSIGRFRGFYLMIVSSAWVIAQLISGSIITKSSYAGIYLFSAGFMVLVSFIFTLFLQDFEDPKYKKVPIIRTIKFFIQNKNISKIYLINLILRFFYAWMIIYSPIYLHEYIGFTWNQIGIIFTIMLLPFVILEFPLGKLSDKIGEKKMLLFGFVIISFFTTIIPLLHTQELWLWAGILFLTRVGAATIEVMGETYFFKSVSEENADAISFFRNAAPLSFVIAPLLAIPVLLFIPSFEYLFFVLDAILLLGLFTTLRLRDVR